MHRRTVLGLPLVAAATALLSACGGEDVAQSQPGPSGKGRTSPIRTAYGDDPSQYGELYLPDGMPRGTVVVIHGGFWLSQYDASLGEPLAADLAARGWAAWNLEYRRVGGGPGGGGGDPQTFDDVHAGIEKLADLGVPLDKVVTLGHSAGGHLAAWAASRGRFDQWPTTVVVTAVVSQAGVLDLVGGAQENLGGGAVQNFLGHTPGPADAPLDPLQQVPLDVPLWCVHGDHDDNVPLVQSQTYVDAATRAGAKAELVEIKGDHFTLIDVGSDAWTKTVEILDGLG